MLKPSTDMKHCIKHDLSPELARKAVAKAAERYTEKWEKYDAKVNWVNEDKADITFHVKGMNVAAHLELIPGQATIEMDVPFVLRPFRKKALSVVEEVIQKWIGKAQRGELD